MGRNLAEFAPAGRDTLVGKPVLRFEDFPLLKGEGRYADDIPVRPGTLHAAILRSPHPHAEIGATDVGAAGPVSASLWRRLLRTTGMGT